MSWEVQTTDEFEKWWFSLTQAQQDALQAGVEVLEAQGPMLGRPLVDTLTGSRFSNLKELRPPTGNMRVLFAFDPQRQAILLVGGDKTGQWSRWSKRMIPKAEQLYRRHLDRINEN